MKTASATKSVPWYKQLTKQQWRAFWAAFIGYFLDGFDFTMVNLLVIDIAKSFDVSPVLATTLIAAGYIPRWFGGLTLGALGDRFGRKPAMVVSILFYAGGSLLCGMAPWFWVLFVARIFVGMGMAGEYGASSTYVMESWPKNMRNKAVGFLISAFSIGGGMTAQVYKLIENAVAGTPAADYAWRILFFIGIIPIAVALWIRRAIPEAEDFKKMKQYHAENNTEQRTDMVSALYLQKNARSAINMATTIISFVALVFIFMRADTVPGVVQFLLWIIVAGTMVSYVVQYQGRRWPIGVAILMMVFISNLINGPMQALMPTYYEASLGLDQTTTANLTSVFFIGQAFGCWAVGFAGDAWGTRRAYWVGQLISAIMLIPVFAITGDMIAADRKWFWMFVVFIMAYEFWVVWLALLPKFIGNYFTTETRNASIGFLFNAGGLGSALAPVLALQLAGDPATGAGGVFPEGFGLGWTLCCLIGSMTLLQVILVSNNFPAKLLKLIHPEEVRPQDLADHDLLTEEDKAELEASGARLSDSLIKTQEVHN